MQESDMQARPPRDRSVDMTLRAHVDSPAYDHSALLYQSEREYVDSLVRFICEGLDRRSR